MENSEILGFQFEPTKALKPDSILIQSDSALIQPYSSSEESWEIFSLADSELSIFR